MGSKLKTLEMKIPFAGFYNSVYSDEVDREESQYCEWKCDESDGDESEWPESLRLDSGEYASILFDVTSYDIAYQAIAREYVESFSAIAGEALGISAVEKVKFYSWADRRNKTERRQVESLRLTFADMSSPREYNFTTDRIFANVPVSVVRKLWTISKGDSHETLTRVARERHTSRSGFISHYRPEWQEWGPVAAWDHNQLETLLIAACDIVGFDWQDSDFGLYYATIESEAGYRAWDSAVDWQAFDARRQESRASKLAEWLEQDPYKARAWIGQDPRSDDLLKVDGIEWPAVDMEDIPYRCQATPDLFA